MNERIKELAEQARLGRGPEKIHISENGVVIFYLNELEKFAELIVQECCDLIMKNQYNMVPGFMERMSAYSEVCMLKEHFGVEND